MGNPIDPPALLNDRIDLLRGYRKDRRDLEKYLISVTYELRAARVNYEIYPPDDNEGVEDEYINKQVLHTFIVEKIYNIDQQILRLVDTLKSS